MCDAFSVRTKNVFAGSSPNAFLAWWLPLARHTTRLTDLLTLIGFADGEGKREIAWWNGWD